MVNSLSGKKSGLQKGKSNISYWDREQQRAYADYLSTPATTQRCTYYYYLGEQCYTISNFTKTLKYNTYSSAFNSYEKAIDTYNALVADYNKTVNTIEKLVDEYQGYQYN